MRINCQIMDCPADDGRYYPDYESLIESAANDDEIAYIRGVRARNCGFAYNMVYVMQMKCGHYELFQTPQNVHHPLPDNLQRAEQFASENKCSACCSQFRAALREVYVRIGTEVINRIPAEFVEFDDFWRTHENDEGFALAYLNERNEIKRFAVETETAIAVSGQVIRLA